MDNKISQTGKDKGFVFSLICGACTLEKDTEIDGDC